MRTVKGTIVSFENGMPTFSIYKDQEGRETKVCVFKMAEDGAPKNAELVRIEARNMDIAPWLYAGRKIQVEGYETHRPRAVAKGDKLIAYANPSVEARNITCLDLPITTQVKRVLDLAEEKNLLDEETFAQFKEQMTKAADEVVKSGQRVREITETKEVQPEVDDENPLD